MATPPSNVQMIRVEGSGVDVAVAGFTGGGFSLMSVSIVVVILFLPETVIVSTTSSLTSN